jgi:transcriptional regulator with XRE-family HTH domain
MRARREALGLSRDELAERARLARSTVQAVEATGRASPSTALRLAEALGLSSADVLLRLRTSVRRGSPRVLAAPPPPPVLVGREALLAALRAHLRPSPSTAGRGQVIALVGPAGIGKTALAARLAHELAAEGPIAWIEGDGSSPPSTGLRAVFLDDVRTEQAAARLAGTVICTTRSQALAEALGARTLPVTALEDHEARELLASYVGHAALDADRDGTRELLRRLGGVPRKLHIAGRALRELAE